jgi:hypothetical protein
MASPADPRCVLTGATESRSTGHMRVLGVNMGLGALTAGVSQHLRGQSFWKGLAGGAAGGGVSYLGKRMVTAEFTASGIAGRELAAVGSSMIANASAGAGVFDRLVFPIGPVRVDVQLRRGFDIRPRVDVPNLVFTLYTAAQPEMDVDWSESLATGAPVFIDRSPPTHWAGRHGLGVIILKESMEAVDPWHPAMPQVLRHERVHLLQHDFTSMVWGRPAEGWILGRIPGGSAVHRYVDLRLDMLAWGIMNAALPHSDRPSEREAYFLNARAAQSMPPR